MSGTSSYITFGYQKKTNNTTKFVVLESFCFENPLDDAASLRLMNKFVYSMVGNWALCALTMKLEIKRWETNTNKNKLYIRSSSTNL